MPPLGGTCTGTPHAYSLDASALSGAGTGPAAEVGCSGVMSPFWVWTQIAIIVFVVIGMVVAITKLA